MKLLEEVYRVRRNARRLKINLSQILDEGTLKGSMSVSQSQMAAAAELWRRRHAELCIALARRLKRLLQHHDKALLAWVVHQKTRLITQPHITSGCLDDLLYEVNSVLRPPKLVALIRGVEHSCRKSESRAGNEQSRRDRNLMRATCSDTIQGEFQLILSEHAETDMLKLRNWIDRHPDSIISALHRKIPEDVERICRALTRTLNRGDADELASIHLGVSINTIRAARSKSRNKVHLRNDDNHTLIIPRTHDS